MRGAVEKRAVEKRAVEKGRIVSDGVVQFGCTAGFPALAGAWDPASKSTVFTAEFTFLR